MVPSKDINNGDLPLVEYARTKLQRDVAGESSLVKDITGTAGILFGMGIRNSSTVVTGFTSRHDDAMKVVAVSGVMAAPVGALVGAGAYAAMSHKPIETGINRSVRRTLDSLGVDSYSGADIARVATEGAKFAVAGAVIRPATTLANSGDRVTN